MSDVPLFYQNWYNKGIIFTADLFCESKLLSLEDLMRTLKIKTNFLDYHRVKARLKKNFSIHLQDPIVKPVWLTTIEILTKSKKKEVKISTSYSLIHVNFILSLIKQSRTQ